MDEKKHNSTGDKRCIMLASLLVLMHTLQQAYFYKQTIIMTCKLYVGHLYGTPSVTRTKNLYRHVGYLFRPKKKEAADGVPYS